MFLRTDGAPSPVSAERQSRMRRPPRSFRSASHPPSVTNLASEKYHLFHLYPISGQLLLKKVLLETFAFTLPPTGAMVKPIFSSHWTSSPNSSHKTLLWFFSEICRVHLRLRLFSRHWCSKNRTRWDSHSHTVSILKILIQFFCRFSQNKLITSFEFKKNQKTLKDSKTLVWLSSISVLFVGGQWCSLSGTTRVPGSISK